MNGILESFYRSSRGWVGAAVLCAAAIPGQALAATASLSTGSSCTWSSYTVDSGNNYSFVCGSTAPSPGQIAFSPTSYQVDISATVNVGVSRTGGSSGAVTATVGATGACTGGGLVSFGDTDAVTKSVTITGGASSGPCTLSLSAATGGATLGGSASVSVNDPTAPGTFAFALASSNTTTGGAHSVTVNRTGGGTASGSYAVAFTEGATPTGYASAAGLSPLTFAGGENTKTISITNTGTAAGAVVYTLTGVTPVGGAPATILGATTTHTVNISTPTAGCPAPAAGTITLNQLASGSAVAPNGAPGTVFTMPLYPGAFRMRVFNTSTTPSSFSAEFGVSTCPGVVYSDWPTYGHVTDPVAGHLGGCRKSAGQTGNSLDVKTVNSLGACWISSAERAPAWYMTVKVTSCGVLSSCSFYIQVD